MGVLQFIPKSGLTPLFGVKLCPVFSKICDELSEINSEIIVKKSLNININRAVAIKEVEDSFGNTFQLLIVYDSLSVKNRSILKIPHTDEGFFDFPIYNLDFNTDIDIEFIIEQGILPKNER
jgi:hypothetical protein